MKIKQNFDIVTGTFDTDTDEIICIKDEKYCEVTLCFKSNLYIPFAKIKLYSGDTYSKAKLVIDDAANLGQEICKRWNSGPLPDVLPITEEYILSLKKYIRVMESLKIYRYQVSTFLNIRVDFNQDGIPKLFLETIGSGFLDTLCKKSIPTIANLKALEKLFEL